jgi:predicted ribosome quality control (RQC) complex YloA/Tae2 family protein
MDAAFFRFLGPELINVLGGVRFDTVFCPAPGLWTFVFSPPVSIAPDSDPDCRFLLLRVHSRTGALLLSSAKPANPQKPPAKAMWLRKRLRGRRVAGGAFDWPSKRLALELTAGEGRYLFLTMDDDPTVLERLPEGFAAGSAWGQASDAAGDGACPRSIRRALDREEPGDRDGFLHAFLDGRSVGFFLSDSPQEEGPLPWPIGRESVRYATALAAAAAYGQTSFFNALLPVDLEPKRTEARRKKRLALLEQDKRRLTDLEGQQLYGEAVAANLSALDPREKLTPMALEHPEHGMMAVPLDPSLTVLENMERFFKKAAKGRRGQVHVERLRLEAEQGAIAQAKARPQQALKKCGKQDKRSQIPLHRFKSSDGFTILRGKNSAANHKLLSELASPFDYWLHAEGGPGAHVIIKRDHPGQDVPETTLREAAMLAGLSSWRAADAKANVLYALASEVRKIKGAALGQVRLENARTLLVDLDPSLEERLRGDG